VRVVVDVLGSLVAHGKLGAHKKIIDKLALARIPLELAAADGPGLKLVEVILEDGFEVGRAPPGFASRELVYHPLPGGLVTSRTRLAFRYVSTACVRELTLAEVLAQSGVELALGHHRHAHHHGSAPHHHHD
jgi:hypothetical protein